MLIYWTTKSLPELAGLSKQQRREVVNATYWKAFRHWETWTAIPVATVCLLFLLDLIDQIPDGSWAPFVKVLVIVLGGFAIGVSLNQVSYRVVRPHMRAFLESNRSSNEEDA